MMNLEQLLRQENCHLKNQITDLKNAFDINRDILRLIAHHDNPNDHQHRLLIQIISKLTSINNEALISNLQLSQEKSILKEENLKLNLEFNLLQRRFSQEIQGSKDSHVSTDPSSSANDASNSLQNSPKSKTQSFQCHQSLNNLVQRMQIDKNQENMGKIWNKDVVIAKKKRKYTQVQSVRLQQTLKETNRQLTSLRRYIEQLENRLILLAKAYKLEEEIKQQVSSYMSKEREESELIKYALKDIKIIKKNDKWMLRLNNRVDNQTSEKRQVQSTSRSWPKHKQFTLQFKPNISGLL